MGEPQEVTFETVWQRIREIPKGSVMTYIGGSPRPWGRTTGSSPEPSGKARRMCPGGGWSTKGGK